MLDEEINLHACRLPKTVAFRVEQAEMPIANLGPATDGLAVAMQVRLNGKALAGDAGFDLDADGRARADTHRLYQLVRLGAGAGERLFEVQFSSPGVCAYAAAAMDSAADQSRSSRARSRSLSGGRWARAPKIIGRWTS